ncbi:MAG: cyclic diguanylate phosphodiesterase [Marinobacterium sp.]|nr:cyclic diguanylate phosphodiesterase [Marinobacterium sp.]
MQHSGREALLSLEAFIERNAQQLKPFIQGKQTDCSGPVVTSLRRAVFSFPYVKEIGLYNEQFRVYCASNDGPVSIRLSPMLRTRLLTADNHQTLSLTRAKISDTRALFFYVYDPLSGRGANVLLQPESLNQLVGEALDDVGAGFQLEVIGRPVRTHGLPEGAALVSQYRFESQRYPLVLTLYQTLGCQFSFIVNYLWVGLLLGSFLSLLYVYRRHQLLRCNSLAQSLLQAISNGELYVCYQPIINVRTGQAEGFEALLRWQHPEQGDISPTIFIPLAEQLNLMVPLTEIVLDDVIRLLHRYRTSFGTRYISINISRHHILQHDLAAMMRQRCYDHPGLNHRLLLELTEEYAFSEAEMLQAINQFERLHECGLRLAVDDFGTGYAGLDFLRRYSFDVLKIDRTFVAGLGAEAALQPLLEAMIQLAHQLDMSIIAEGIELPHQAQMLHQMGINCMQGFLFTEPVRAGQLKPWFNDTLGADVLTDQVLSDMSKYAMSSDKQGISGTGC